MKELRSRALAFIGAAALFGFGLVAAATPSLADTPVGTCVVKDNPTPVAHSVCTNMDLSGRFFASLRLDYGQYNNTKFDFAFFNNTSLFAATLTGASFSFTTFLGGPMADLGADVSNLDFDHATFDGLFLNLNAQGANFEAASFLRIPGHFLANFTDANLASATFCSQFTTCPGSEIDATGMTFRRTNLDLATLHGVAFTSADFTDATLTSVDTRGSSFFDASFTGANLAGADFSGAEIAGADFSKTLLVPRDQSVSATSSNGAVVAWPTPMSLPGATPGSCDHPSGSVFPIGTTHVTCEVLGTPGNTAGGTFDVTVGATNAAADFLGGPGVVATAGPPSAINPIVTEVRTTDAGLVTILESTPSVPPPTGYSFAGVEAQITAPPGTVTNPLVLRFSIPVSVLTAAGTDVAHVVIVRNGSLPAASGPVETCGPGTAANPNPCVSLRTSTGGIATFEVRTSNASRWDFARPPSTFTVLTATLPTGKVGQAYNATLLTSGSPTLPLKWKKVGKLPKGLKLDKVTGRISGTPKQAGTFGFGIQVSDAAKKAAKKTASRTFSVTVH